MEKIDSRTAYRRGNTYHRAHGLSLAFALGIELTAFAVWADTSASWIGGGGPFWTDSPSWGLLPPCFPINGGCVVPDGPPEERWHVTLVHVPFAGPFLDRDVVLTELVIQEGALGGDVDRHDLTVQENMIWLGGPAGHDLGGVGTLRSQGTLTINGGGGVGTSRDLVNDGAGTLTGSLIINAPGTLTNSAGATFALTGDGGIGTVNFPRPTFTNNGLLQKVGGGLFALGIFLNNVSGALVDVQSGTLRILADDGSGSGRFTVGSGATLDFAMAAGTFVLDSTSTVDGEGTVLLSRSTVDSRADWNVAGTTAVSGGLVNFLAPATTQSAVLTGGRITGDLLIQGMLRWEDGAMTGPGTTFLDADADILTGGPSGGPNLEDRQLNLTPGHTINLLIDLGAHGSTINNPPGGTFNMSASLGRHSFGSFPIFNNDGDFIKISPRTSVLGWVFVNTGLVDITDGELLVSASFTQTSGETRLSGGRLTGDTVQIRGGQLTGPGQVNCPVSNDGTISPGSPSGTGTLLFNSTLTLGATSALAFNVGGRAQGTEYDFITVPLWGLALNGRIEIRFRNGFESSVAGGDAFVLAQACCQLSGSFANAASGSDIPTADGLGRFTIYYGAGSSFPSNQVVITNFRP